MSLFAPPALVFAVYGAWLLVAAASSHDARDFIYLSTVRLEQCRGSSAIRVDPRYPYQRGSAGYDGQYYYFIALDPGHAACYIDDPPYRYERILYPMLARFVALGQSAAIPTAMVLINLFALAGGTLVIARWLMLKGFSPWFAVIYGFYPGLFTCLWRDLTEPLSYGLVALAVYLFDFGGRRGALLAGISFGLAALSRETALIFTVVYGLSCLFRRDVRRALWVLGFGVVPFVAYVGFLRAWLGAGTSPAVPPAPFGGLAHYWPWPPEQVDLALSVALPGLICAGVAVWALAGRVRSVEIWSLLANVAILVVWLQEGSYAEYFATGRVAAGVVLAALFCLPAFQRALRGKWWLWVTTTLWFLPWYTLVPGALLWANGRL